MYIKSDSFLINTTLIIITLISLSFVLSWYTAKKQAEVYNIQNGTNFTTADFLWASDQINSNSQTIKIK